MTTDRDIRLSSSQIVYLERTCRRRISELGRTISRTEANRAAGATIQHGTLQAHYEELGELCHVREALEVARRQIAHQTAAQLGIREG